MKDHRQVVKCEARNAKHGTPAKHTTNNGTQRGDGAICQLIRRTFGTLFTLHHIAGVSLRFTACLCSVVLSGLAKPYMDIKGFLMIAFQNRCNTHPNMPMMAKKRPSHEEKTTWKAFPCTRISSPFTRKGFPFARKSFPLSFIPIVAIFSLETRIVREQAVKVFILISPIG